jgi:uncharacterized membrane protein
MRVLFNVVKFFHILFVITAVGSNITYGVWQGFAGNDLERQRFALRGVKFLDDHVANPAYILVLITGLTMAGWHYSFSTRWIAAAIVLFVIAILVGLAVYSPALTRQIEVLEREGLATASYRRASIRATAFGIGVFVPILLILYLMINKPSLG